MEIYLYEPSLLENIVWSTLVIAAIYIGSKWRARS